MGGEGHFCPQLYGGSPTPGETCCEFARSKQSRQDFGSEGACRDERVRGAVPWLLGLLECVCVIGTAARQQIQ